MHAGAEVAFIHKKLFYPYIGKIYEKMETKLGLCIANQQSGFYSNNYTKLWIIM